MSNDIPETNENQGEEELMHSLLLRSISKSFLYLLILPS